MEQIKDKGTALQIMQELTSLGYQDSFEIRDRILWCIQTEMTYSPPDVSLEATFRFEGGTNPDDLGILFVFRCADGTGGFIMDAYGLNADPDVNRFFNLVMDRREHSVIMDGLPASKVLRITAS